MYGVAIQTQFLITYLIYSSLQLSELNIKALIIRLILCGSKLCAQETKSLY